LKRRPFRPCLEALEARSLLNAGALDPTLGVSLAWQYYAAFCIYGHFINLPGIGAFRAISRISVVASFATCVAVAFWLTVLYRWAWQRFTWGGAIFSMALLMLLVTVDQLSARPWFMTYEKAKWQRRTQAVPPTVPATPAATRLMLANMRK